MLQKLEQSVITNPYFNPSAKPGKPEGPLEVSNIHKDGCTLKWNKPKDDGGEPLEGKLVKQKLKF